MSVNLEKRYYTKAERRFGELLKKHRIPFRAKVQIGGREVDFLIGNYAVEINGHEQDTNKNSMLVSKGYVPIHFQNVDIKNTLKAETWLKQILTSMGLKAQNE